jgi:hypothetical protein
MEFQRDSLARMVIMIMSEISLFFYAKMEQSWFNPILTKYAKYCILLPWGCSFINTFWKWRFNYYDLAVNSPSPRSQNSGKILMIIIGTRRDSR